jgi:hypothetical protein
MSSTFFFKVTGGANPLLALKKKKVQLQTSRKKKEGRGRTGV